MQSIDIVATSSEMFHLIDPVFHLTGPHQPLATRPALSIRVQSVFYVDASVDPQFDTFDFRPPESFNLVCTLPGGLSSKIDTLSLASNAAALYKTAGSAVDELLLQLHLGQADERVVLVQNKMPKCSNPACLGRLDSRKRMPRCARRRCRSRFSVTERLCLSQSFC